MNEKKLINKIVTPLGEILLDIEFINFNISDINYSTCCNINGKGYITGWYTDVFEAELLICRPKLNLPSHMKVDDCYSAMWRLKVKENSLKCKFCTRWVGNYRWTSGSANSGEGLDAQTWENEKTIITLGTQDGEKIMSRKQKEDKMPIKFDSDIDMYSFIQYENSGLSIEIDELIPNETCQVHFAVAWANKINNDISTWLAVDLNENDIIGEIVK
ncbi:hypothetical protein [Alkaliphilus hydrothermalis]|nr:hypothetical protein [Alkaliphilus hydrothermalis]